MSITVLSPLKGKLVPIESVSDPVFSEKMLGDGVAIVPDEGIVVAPVSGVISALPASGHAFGMIISQGLELLVHIGIDTVDMDGNGFQLFVSKGDSVEAGQKILEFSIDEILTFGKSTVSPVVATGCEIKVLANEQVERAQPLFEILGEVS